MSRAGKYPVKLLDGVSAEIKDNAVVIKGPKGELSVKLDTKNSHLVDVEIKDDNSPVTIADKSADEIIRPILEGVDEENMDELINYLTNLHNSLELYPLCGYSPYTLDENKMIS